MSLRKYLDNINANVAPMLDAKETRTTAIIVSKIIPANRPKARATGKDNDAAKMYPVKKIISTT